MYTGYVYLITNLLNGKVYVGKTTFTPEIRWREHIEWSKTQRVYLSHAIKKYGLENFTVSTLAVVHRDSTKELRQALDELEKLWIVCFRSSDSNFGYNMTFGGEGGRPTEAVKKKIAAARKGQKWTSEQRRKHAETWAKREPHPNKGKKQDPTRLARMNATRLSKPVSAETRAKLSTAGKNQVQSAATRRMRSLHMKGADNPMFGTRWNVLPDGTRVRIQCRSQSVLIKARRK